MTRVRKWAMLRVPLQTHRQLQEIKRRAGMPMSEVVKRIVGHIYAGGPMQALTFFVIYLDGQAAFIVASKDAATAELGLRQQLLGSKPAPKEIKARALVEAPTDDVLRVGVAAILTQLTNLNAALGSFMPPPGHLKKLT